MRGQVFTFGDRTWCTMGGAASHNIRDGILAPADPDFERQYWLMRRMWAMFRVKGHSWRQEEIPTDQEYAEVLRNLETVNWKANCILPHCAPSHIARKIDPSYGVNQLTDFLK